MDITGGALPAGVMGITKMALSDSYPSHEAARDDLIALGFRASDTGSGYFTKATTRSLDGSPCVAICKVTYNRVDPQWNAPDYWTVDFV